uniref:Uncharacterized protein n=1 Tax=Anguilla anguilla TaxID=7936 RepID=A0A0E9XFE4_ANGAN
MLFDVILRGLAKTFHFISNDQCVAHPFIVNLTFSKALTFKHANLLGHLGHRYL